MLAVVLVAVLSGPAGPAARAVRRLARTVPAVRTGAAAVQVRRREHGLVQGRGEQSMLPQEVVVH